jgi:tetratricopeptide (TPR) repeat protein
MMTALFHAERAVTLAPDDASALELRGSLRFEVSRNDRLTEPAELRAAAERDLSAAVAADPLRSEAWRDLSQLNRVEARFAEAKGNAERALEADPFLSEDRDVLFTLYQSSQELGDMNETVRWCAEGHRRFPDDFGFVACSLFVLALSRGPAPDVSRAWALLDTLVQTTRPQQRNTNRRLGETWVAAVLARAGNEDSARSVLQRARDNASGELKPWLDYTGANVMLLLGDRQQALALLDSFLEAVPQRRQYIASDWMFEDLWDDPRFKELVAAEQ